MNREELKKKIVEELKKEMAPIEYGDDREHAPEVHYPSEEEIADALIAAGLRFGENLTATFDLMALERYHALERRLAEAEHRAEVAERALDKATELAYEYRTQDDTLSCSSCPFDSIFDRCKERGLYEDCSKRWKEELLQQAEKELAEEGKDD